MRRPHQLATEVVRDGLPGECRHPALKRIEDQETGQINCGKCGEDLPASKLHSSTAETLHHTPTNASVFRNNMSPTSKRNSDQKGPEPYHLDVLGRAIYGNKTIRPTERITKTCPACGTQQPLPVFGNNIACVNSDCGIELGHFVFRFLPHTPENPNNNGESNQRLRYWADLRLIQAWDPPEDNETLRIARQIFSETVKPLELADEDAHFLANQYLKGVKAATQTYKRDLRDLLTGLLTMKGITTK